MTLLQCHPCPHGIHGFGRVPLIPVAADNTHSGIATHYNTMTLQHYHLSAVVGILSPLVFKSPVKSGYWVPNMVTETLTG